MKAASMRVVSDNDAPEGAAGGNRASVEKHLFESFVAIETSKRDLAEQRKDLIAEAKSSIGKEDTKALLLNVRRHFDTEEKREERLAVEFNAEQMAERLGPFRDTPLGAAALRGGGH